MINWLGYIMFTMGIFELIIGLNVFIKEDKKRIINWYFLFLCFGGFLWCVSYAVLAASDGINDAARYWIRTIMLLGIVLCNGLCITMFTEWSRIKELPKTIIQISTLIISIVAFFCIIQKDTASFVLTSYGWSYIHNYSINRMVYTVYVLIIMTVIFSLCIYGFITAKKKRIIVVMKISLIGLIILIIGSFFDVWRQFFGKPVFPGSAIAMSIVILIIYFVTIKLTVNQITVQNISESLYKLVNSPIFIINEDGYIINANQSAYKFLGISKDELDQGRLEDLFALNLETIQTSQNSDKNDGSYYVEAECKLRDARCQLTVNRFKDVMGEHLGDIVTIADLTDRLRMIDELKKSREEAIKANSAKSAFLANISHDMRTPLNVIVGMSEIAKAQNPEKAVADAIDNIHAAGNDLLTMINDLLDLSKIEADRYELVTASYSLIEMMNEIVEVNQVQFYNRPVNLYVAVNPNLPEELIGDDIRIKRIILNLLSNASKFTDTGYVRFYVDGCFDDGETGTMIFSVTDTGTGIQTKDMDKLFEVYSQFDSRMNRELHGSGLGLTISRHFARLMGGDITVTSNYGKGSTFTVKITQRVMNHRPIGEAVNQQNKEILFCGLPEEFLQMESVPLAEMGIHYDQASSPRMIQNADKYSYIVLPHELLKAEQRYLETIFTRDQIIVFSRFLFEIDNQKEYDDYKKATIPLFELQMAYLLNHNKPMYSRKNGKRAEQVRETRYEEKKVLIVDDSITNLKVACGLMKPYGMIIDTAGSGEKAIECMQVKDYDLIFMDHMMPVMDGIDTVREIRSREKWNSIPVIALTANALAGTRDFFLENGFQDFLSKPIYVQELDRILAKYLK